MEKDRITAKCIAQIEINSMWGKKHIVWNLRPDVNILSGVNGVGKSTILSMAIKQLECFNGNLAETGTTDISFSFEPSNAQYLNYEFIQSVDRPLISGLLSEKVNDSKVVTELDWRIYQLQRRYLDYQVNIGNRTIQMLTSGDPQKVAKAANMSANRILFFDIMDSLFAHTGKTIVRDCNEIMFDIDGERLSPYSLSSGEKQILVIFLTILVQDNRPFVLFMDEPDISLHVEWQQQLIRRILSLNSNVQIILTTHSPAVIMDGWIDAVTEVEDITVK